jgi:4-amino-4-deoxy-L-arabinose transferase-like glycosyltransferase
MKDEVKFSATLLNPRVRFPRRIRSFILHPSSFILDFLHPSSFILVSLCGLLFFKGIASREMWASHEARAAQNAQRLLDDGNWLLPRLYDGQVELQKPPGFYWLVAVVGWVRGGVDEWAVRLPAAIAGTLTVFLVWGHLRARGRPVAAFVAAAALAGAVHFTGTARIGRIDVPLACVVTSIMLVARATLGERSGVSRPMLASLLIGLLAGVALLLKGPIGVALPAAALGIVLLIERIPIRPLLRPALVAGTVALAIAVPWFLWADAETNGELYSVFILHHHFHRAFGGSETLAGHPWWYYVPRFAADFLPWTPLLLVALASRAWRADPDARFGLVWLVAMVALLSFSRFKRADYLLPAYPGAAIFLGCAIERWYLSRTRRMHGGAVVGFALILLSLPLGWLVFDHVVTANEEAARDQRPFARHIREITPAPQPVVLFRVESHLLVYHLGRPVHTLVEWADLHAAIREPGTHFVVTRAEFLDEVRTQIAVPLTVVIRSEDSVGSRARQPLVLLRIDNETWPTTPRD